MVIAVRTEERDGRLVVVKEAGTDDDVRRLTEEAAVLTRVRHRGVVQLSAVRDRTIELRHGGTALSRLFPLPLDHGVAVLADAADAIDATHRSGIAHGALGADHVLVDAQGRVRLCGFGSASDVTDDGVADDISALGTMLEEVLLTSEQLVLADPGRRAGRSMRLRAARRDLAALAARANNPEPGARPTARQFSKALHVAIPQARTPRSGGTASWSVADLSFLGAEDHDEAEHALAALGAGPEAEPGVFSPAADQMGDEDDHASAPDPVRVALGAGTSSRRGARTLQITVATIALAVGVVGGVAGARAIDPFADAAADTPTQVAATASTTTTSSSTTAPRRVDAGRWPLRCSVTVPTGPDIDGDGCPDAIELVGRTATIGTVSFTLGEDGDEIALGDWDCDGVATPALLRPTSGEVFVFPNWTVDEPLSVRAIVLVPGARRLDAGGGECPELFAITQDGRERVRT